ncbi:hypothetical protein CORC01_07121 [Colletotrichum orchidophilum]|uniref:Uncharacterized protein n=1 Tax=Colletotrichum orchidophilum TaxID=1209926 RepID=A0A1G4B840_9PEZI|nr:uncharacterized protein CORC01_07121 [Colletotrichum orchidophilum]OHE97506.1 hypothetical protein CORC01_07121 [Colletotrichum orchidophilum]
MSDSPGSTGRIHHVSRPHWIFDAAPPILATSSTNPDFHVNITTPALTNPLSVIDRGTPQLTPSSEDPPPQLEVHLQHHDTASQDSLRNRPRLGTQCSAGFPQNLAAPRPRRRVPDTTENRPMPFSDAQRRRIAVCS